ncbi:MAG TPA: hypothetical protein VF895_02560 [Gaiellaceae bacterium]
MKAALLVLALAAALALPAASGSALAAKPRTVVTGGPIQAFAMDGNRIAWIAGVCQTVRVRRVNGGKPAVVGDGKLTECDNRGTPSVALAGTRVLWTNLTFGNFTYTYVRTRAVGEKARPKQIDYIVHQNDLDGDYLTAMAGDAGTLAYTDLVVSGRTLPSDEDVYFADRGTVRRVVGRERKIMRGTTPPFRIAVASGRVAVVPADRSEGQSVALRGALNGIVEVRDLTGNVISHFTPVGRVRAIALTGTYAAVLVSGRVERYKLPSGTLTGATPVPGAAPELDASGRTVILRVGKTIKALDTASGSLKTVATASATPIGLSIEGRVVAWAENLHQGGRIRTMKL